MKTLNGTWIYYSNEPIMFIFVAIITVLIEISIIMLFYEPLKKKFGNIGIFMTILFSNLITLALGYLIYFGV